MKKMEMGCKNREKLIVFGLIFHPDCERFSIFFQNDANRIEDILTEHEWMNENLPLLFLFTDLCLPPLQLQPSASPSALSLPMQTIFCFVSHVGDREALAVSESFALFLDSNFYV